jgi:high affinity Mn2+ porin
MVMRNAILSGAAALAAAVIGPLSWSIMCRAQMVGPTPQPQGIPVAPQQAERVEPESWAVHAQATLTWLLQPAFRSPYQGPQSLSPAANGRETIDATLYGGIRPWPGAEIWINPEVDQGFGLSNTFGVAGYPSGEAYKVGKAEPYVLVQRGFLRHTIGLGGETEKLEPDLNQLGGPLTAERLVFTIGKYSVVDIFDTNTYAHDPRNDFFNWSIIDQGAFDYAANSWGYTYGGAVEWYQDWWTIRAGVFDLSQAPNAPALSHGFGQGQFVPELEERHSLWDQPGKLKFLYWLTRGNLGTYLDAISFGEATGTTPSTGAVRSFRTKGGLGLNLEQPLATDFGVFARASVSQGTVEEVDFTDINKSLSAGLSLKGLRWDGPMTPSDWLEQSTGYQTRASCILALAVWAGSSATDNCRMPAPNKSLKCITASSYSASPASRPTTSSSITQLTTAIADQYRSSACGCAYNIDRDLCFVVADQGMSSTSHLFAGAASARFHQPPPKAWNNAAVSA